MLLPLPSRVHVLNLPSYRVRRAAALVQSGFILVVLCVFALNLLRCVQGPSPGNLTLFSSAFPTVSGNNLGKQKSCMEKHFLSNYKLSTWTDFF